MLQNLLLEVRTLNIVDQFGSHMPDITLILESRDELGWMSAGRLRLRVSILLLLLRRRGKREAVRLQERWVT